MKHMNYRIGNIELRSTGKHLIRDDDKITTCEIILWFDGVKRESCCTIAHWKRDTEGFDLKFVGSRPLGDDVRVSDFWCLVKAGQEFLDKYEDEVDDG